MFAIARNIRVDRLRRAHRMALRRGDLSEHAAPGDESDHLERDELALRVRSAMTELPSGYRQLLVLRYDQGLSYRAIAGAEGISENAVALRIYRARRLLQRRLRDLAG